MRQIKVNSERITNRGSKAVMSYFNDLKDSVPLDPEIEYEVAVKACEGDEAARNKLIEANLKFVVSVAKQFERNGVKLEDLINEGNIGLIESVKTFDPTRGFKFISYAVWKIRQKMQAYINDNSKTIRIPMNKTSITNKMRRRVSYLEQRLERPPMYDEIMSELSDDFKKEDIEFFISMNSLETTSLDKPLGGDNTNNSLVDILDDINSDDPSKVLDNENGQYNRNFLLSTLTRKEAITLELLFGFNGHEPFTPDEVAEEFGVTTQVIYQTRKRAIKKLKYTLKNQAKWMTEN